MLCDRCKKEMTTFKMSWFNTQNICPACQKEEQKHPDFLKAKFAVLEEERKGNLNFEGIGLPQDLIK